MTKKQRNAIAIFASLSMMILILDSKNALRSAIAGVELCLYTVLPALFPFFLFSTLLTAALHGTALPIPQWLRKAMGLPIGGESLLLIGLLGGYPTGAHSIAQVYKEGGINEKTATRMLGYCVNAGPAFLFGICTGLFSSPVIAFVLWGIHILAAIFTAILLPEKTMDGRVETNTKALGLTEALRLSVFNMSQVCAWVVMSRVLIGFLDRWFLWLFPSQIRVLLLGLIELTNGCTALAELQQEDLRFLLCSAMLAFGGLSVAMQVSSVTGKLGAGMFVHGKLMHCALSILLALMASCILFPGMRPEAYMHIIGLLLGGIITAMVPYSRFYKKRSSNSLNYHV